jgi:WD40 repeat protein
VSFSPDGRRLISAGEDGHVRVWSLEPATEDLPTLTRLAVDLCAATLDASGNLSSKEDEPAARASADGPRR